MKQLNALSQSIDQEVNIPLVTVILSTYNWSAVLPYSIGTVLNQTFVNFELLVIGDGCTDDSKQVVESFQDSRVRWINLTRNSGSQSGPNNEGLRQARGKLIAYLGHDDLWSQYHLESLISFCREKEDVFASAAIIWFEEDCKVRFIGALNELMDKPNYANTSAIMHSRSLIDQVGFWKEYSSGQNFYPDLEFFARMKIIQPKFMIGSVSVAKVPASWRKNIYKRLDITPQKILFDALVENPLFLRETALAFYAAKDNRLINADALWRMVKRPLEFVRHTIENLQLRYVQQRAGYSSQDEATTRNHYEEYRRFKGLE
ncbi:glycosyltransferase family A protein [Polynucleobacter sp. JS-JIR-II-b4]|uniref:glycosyltransferase family 2 protein n=1 Tax=Polynucleobacter sp. JS-JIR-II-b4 TaxID=1758390 RepID=UPI001BFDA57D|nr:glycosyltransferase family A protein [Polynucleobacter sp. JS-JIR-II-b4]QWE02877.1 glycosyltransferase family 2 protein [Polynucleobacter sp. JS-JIR-II-b4]